MAHSHSIAHNHPAVSTSAAGSHVHAGNAGSGRFIAESISGQGNLHAGAGDDMQVASATAAAGNHAHTVDLPAYSGSSGGSSSSSTGGASTSTTGGSSISSTSAGGAGNTSLNDAANTGDGPGNSTPFDVQQRALRVNYFIYAGVD